MGLFRRSKAPRDGLGTALWQRSQSIELLQMAVSQGNYGAVQDVHAHLARFMPDEEMLGYLITQVDALYEAGDTRTGELLASFIRAVSSTYPFETLTTEQWALLRAAEGTA